MNGSTLLFLSTLICSCLLTLVGATTDASYCGFPVSGHPETATICSQAATTLQDCEQSRFFTSLPCFWEGGRCTSQAAVTGEDFTCINISEPAFCKETRFNGARYCTWYEATNIPSMVPSSHVPSSVPSLTPTTGSPSTSPTIAPSFNPTVPGDTSRPTTAPTTMEPTSIPSTTAPSFSPTTSMPSFGGPTVSICGYPNDPNPWSMDRVCSFVSTKESCISQLRFVQTNCEWNDATCYGDDSACGTFANHGDCISQTYGAVVYCEWYEMVMEEPPTMSPSNNPSEETPTDGTIRYCGHSANSNDPFETPLKLCSGANTPDACTETLHYSRTWCIWVGNDGCLSGEDDELVFDPCASRPAEELCSGTTPLSSRYCAWYDSSTHVDDFSSSPTLVPPTTSAPDPTTLVPTTILATNAIEVPSAAPMNPSGLQSLNPSIELPSTSPSILPVQEIKPINAGTLSSVPSSPSALLTATPSIEPFFGELFNSTNGTDTENVDEEETEEEDSEGSIEVAAWLFIGISAGIVVVGVFLIKKVFGSSKKNEDTQSSFADQHSELGDEENNAGAHSNENDSCGDSVERHFLSLMGTTDVV